MHEGKGRDRAGKGSVKEWKDVKGILLVVYLHRAVVLVGGKQQL